MLQTLITRVFIIKKTMIYFEIDGPLIGAPLTVDSTLITVDSTLITVDATVQGYYPYLIDTLTSFSSNDFTIQLKNELTQEISTLDVQYFYYKGDRLMAYFDFDFTEGDAFEVKVLDASGRLMRRDKAYASSQQDTENFQLIPRVDTPNAPDDGLIILD